MPTIFNVTMDVEDMEGKTVLVFLRPTDPQRDYRIHAWQVLNGSAGATESFEYDSVISTIISSEGIKPGERTVSAMMNVEPGSLLQAASAEGVPPKLDAASVSLAAKKLKPRQAGVINQTNPFIQFDCHWHVNGKPVVTMPNVDAGATSSFEYEPNLYFMVASSPTVGQSAVIEDFTDMTCVPIPDAATEVDVVLTKHQGDWNFNFKEKG